MVANVQSFDDLSSSVAQCTHLPPLQLASKCEHIIQIGYGLPSPFSVSVERPVCNLQMPLMLTHQNTFTTPFRSDCLNRTALRKN